MFYIFCPVWIIFVIIFHIMLFVIEGFVKHFAVSGKSVNKILPASYKLSPDLSKTLYRRCNTNVCVMSYLKIGAVIFIRFLVL